MGHQIKRRTSIISSLTAQVLAIVLLAGCIAVPKSSAFLVPQQPRQHEWQRNAAPDKEEPLVPPTPVSPAQSSSSSSSSSASSSSSVALDTASLGNDLLEQAKEVAACVQLALSPFLKSDDSVQAADIVAVCDALDQVAENGSNNEKLSVIRQWALQMQRHELLVKLMRRDYDAYVATASFLSPSRIPRLELPNIQDVPYDGDKEAAAATSKGGDLVPDCELEDLKYSDSLLDQLLLKAFRSLVTKHTNGVTSDQAGIEGLLEQGRTYLLQPNQTADAQHTMVRNTLGGLMTPVLPPFYRIFMSGIIPKNDNFGEWAGKQVGPWFYAPFLTSWVTPTFFGFLVGPSRPNRRRDGQPGGLVVEKCKFLQESGCKGLCLHQCKLPAQQFFQDELGLALTVSPNFVTQECQWSFGETPVPVADDPSFPTGCLQGCPSRQALATAGSRADICNE